MQMKKESRVTRILNQVSISQIQPVISDYNENDLPLYDT